MVPEAPPLLNHFFKRGHILTKGTVYQTEGAALAIFCLGYQHPGHEGHSPLGKSSDTVQ